MNYVRMGLSITLLMLGLLIVIAQVPTTKSKLIEIGAQFNERKIRCPRKLTS